jgi:sugar lactone lactonase YvrE
MTNSIVATAAAVVLAATSAAAAQDRLETVFSSNLLINGPTTSQGGRLFLVAQPAKPETTLQVFEVRDGKTFAYPDVHWNAWKLGTSGRDHFVGVNAIRIGPDGSLWAVDRGRPGIGGPLAAGGPKLVKIDIKSNKVSRVYDLADVIRPWSFVDDVRFNGGNAYLTDAGSPGLIVLDLASGKGRRVLDGHPSTVAQSPLVAEGKPLKFRNGDPVNVHADQLEVSPDGKWFYYQPCSGRLSRIETRYLDDDNLSDAELASHVERFADTPSTGGTAIDDSGTIYLSDTDAKRILTISPEGKIAILISDPRLAWVDAMWIDDNGYLLLPAAQLNRTAGLNGGVDAVEEPITLYRLKIGRNGVRR